MELDLFITQLLRIYQARSNEFQFVRIFTAQEKLAFLKLSLSRRLPEHRAYASAIELISFLLAHFSNFLLQHFRVFVKKRKKKKKKDQFLFIFAHNADPLQPPHHQHQHKALHML